MKKLLLIPGSLRKHSFNKSLAMIAEEYLKTKPEVEVSVLDYSKLPVLNMDDSYPFPETVNEVREKIFEADGLWFSVLNTMEAFQAVLKICLIMLLYPMREIILLLDLH